MLEKILIIDDEANVLEALKRELGAKYQVVTAISGMEGLQKNEKEGPFSVVITDYRMPKMNGVQFLIELNKVSPDTVKMLLTGNADMNTAIEAVNEGQVFRFLTKPCSQSLLIKSIDAGIKQYRLVLAEKELLEKTLLESINMLTEILSIINPRAYGRSLRLRQSVKHIATRLNVASAWQYETAAALSQLGWIIFPPAMLEKLESNQPLSTSENILFLRHPFTTKKLLEKIPRMETVSAIIEGQERSIADLCLDPSAPEQFYVDLGSHILKVCVDYDRLRTSGSNHETAVAALVKEKQKYNADVLEALSTLRSYRPNPGNIPEPYKIEDFEIGMITAEPIKTSFGEVLVPQDTRVTHSIIVQLFSLTNRPGYVIEPIKMIKT